MTVPETLTLVGIAATCLIGLATAIIGVINLFITHKFSMRLKAFEIRASEIHVINVKIYDILTRVEDSINSNKPPSDDVKERLRLNANRLIKYDNTIIADINLLIESWSAMISLIESGNNFDKLSKSRSDINALIDKIRDKVDKLQMQ